RNAEFKSLSSSFSDQPSASKLHPLSLQPSDSGLRTPDSGLLLRLQLVGANPNPQVRGLEELPGKVNYFLGNDPTRWRTNLPTYASIVYNSLYPGVDLSYSGDSAQLKGTYTLAAGADPGRIQWRYANAGGVSLDAAGNLRVSVA